MCSSRLFKTFLTLKYWNEHLENSSSWRCAYVNHYDRFTLFICCTMFCRLDEFPTHQLYWNWMCASLELALGNWVVYVGDSLDFNLICSFLYEIIKLYWHSTLPSMQPTKSRFHKLHSYSIVYGCENDLYRLNKIILFQYLFVGRNCN